MMNAMSNNKLNIEELEMVNGGGFWDVLVEAISSIVKPTVDVGIETLEDILRYLVRPLGSP